jgi:hypothetical protein
MSLEAKTRSQHVSKNKKKGQVIHMLALKQKVQHHYMKQDDGVSIIGKEHNNYLFLFFVKNFLLFFYL